MIDRHHGDGLSVSPEENQRRAAQHCEQRCPQCGGDEEHDQCRNHKAIRRHDGVCRQAREQTGEAQCQHVFTPTVVRVPQQPPGYQGKADRQDK